MLIKSLSSVFKKILDKIVKNKDLNLKIREGVKNFLDTILNGFLITLN